VDAEDFLRRTIESRPFTPLSVCLSKIAHFYRLIVTGVVGRPRLLTGRHRHGQPTFPTTISPVDPSL
jgi:hypothetical protein